MKPGFALSLTLCHAFSPQQSEEEALHSDHASRQRTAGGGREPPPPPFWVALGSGSLRMTSNPLAKSGIFGAPD